MEIGRRKINPENENLAPPGTAKSLLYASNTARVYFWNKNCD